jgi:biopolymer transport protein ExbB/TolQ
MAYTHTTDMTTGLHGLSQVGSRAPAEDGDQQVNWLLARTRSARAKPYHYLLLLRFALINLLGFALLGAAYVQGWVDKVLVADQSYLSIVIAVVFLGGLALCALRVWQTSRDINQVKAFNPLSSSMTADYIAKLRGRNGESRAILASTLRLKLSQRITAVRHAGGSLVLLGLIGTVVGFIIALSGVDPEGASDVKSIAPMVSTLIGGLSTALYTTLVGSVLNVWLMINYRLLAGGTVKLITALVEFGEDHGRT